MAKNDIKIEEVTSKKEEEEKPKKPISFLNKK